ncbi:Flp family type IVb pilin [Geminicoccus harenae]|uniref:Flp family type IVb pilin n=1 Tax=Geminicoccus harenae TaxID=2498453 RepID=UPI001C984AFC|nr:Flp family type IVb pilin [Geminicoccus harenae]
MVEMVTSRVMAALACRKGVTALEYGVIAAGIVLVVAGGVVLMAPQLTATFGQVTTALTP